MSWSNKYWALVNSLVDRGIVSASQWSVLDPVEYDYYASARRRGFRVYQILDDVVKHMSWNHTLYYYTVLGNAAYGNIRTNKVYDLLTRNGYSPEKVGTLLVHWSNLISPRNCLWVSGTEDGMARSFARSLFYLGPIRGYLRWRDKVNPFRGCKRSLVLWWDVYLPEDCVGWGKQVLAGEYITVPRTGGERYDTEMFKTPVIAHGMDDATLVKLPDGMVTKEYSDQLRNLMYRLDLREPPSQQTDVISCDDMRRFLTWASDHQTFTENEHDMRLL